MDELLAGPREPELLWRGARWAEGPAWLEERGVLRFSDIPNDRILEYSPVSEEVSEYGTGTGFVNGRAVDRSGAVVQCSNRERWVERDRDGVVTVVADRCDGRRFNSPNDVIVGSDGVIWFTDPPYGLGRGNDGTREYPGCYVFRCDEVAGEVRAVVTDMVHPNGLALSPDESRLYVADTGSDRGDGSQDAMRVYDIVGAECRDGREFASPGHVDGFRVDREGRLWCSASDDLVVLSSSGVELLRIPFGETVTNVSFGGGGADGTDLYVTSETALWRLRAATGPAVRASGR